MKSSLKIAVVEPSLIIRNGIVSVLRRQLSLPVEIIEITDLTRLASILSCRKPDILVIDPALLGVFSLSQMRKEANGLKCVALRHTAVDPVVLKGYDGEITIYDTAESICEKIEKLSESSAEASLQEGPLTDREKEIITGVVKGWTNKQIADKLCLSTYTVITHRRNIAAKLQIHSAAGLTIYAIVNHFVDINEVKGSIYRQEK
ncbi:MAG: response regulator transcription factor [Porphyromonadaceae bacterium]|nr:response regulator transcription factor [Porphyromonadaceae bacterium]